MTFDRHLKNYLEYHKMHNFLSERIPAGRKTK